MTTSQPDGGEFIDRFPAEILEEGFELPPAEYSQEPRVTEAGFLWREHIPTHREGEDPYEYTKGVHGQLTDGPRVFEPLEPHYPGGSAEMLRIARRNVARALGIDLDSTAAGPLVHPESVAPATFNTTREEIARAVGMAADDPEATGLYPKVIEVTLLDGSTGYYEIEET